MMRNSSISGYPFTPTQWQELEHQALIYKYMASGIPIPSDLLLPIRRSFFLNSTTPTIIPPPHFSQPTIGWGCFHQMGYGRKAEDPEPGRCRRTDGKKWRCSKEAYPDSKYCERHMHRGKNRSRKPVEISLNTTATTNSNPSSSSSSITSSSLNQHPSLLPLSISAPDQSSSSSYYPYQLHYPPHPYAATHNSDRDYNRFFQGMKDVDDYTFFSEASAAATGGRGSSWELRPLGLGEPKDYTKEGKEKNEHCFVLGADFKIGKSAKEREEEEEENQRPLRHFFDESPHKGRDSNWMDLEGDSSNTQLSISIPMGFHDLQQWFVATAFFFLVFF